jgi:hypothetical protein
VLHTEIAIRFSSFGKMATICTSLARSEWSAFPLQALAELLAEHGYIYVDAKALDEPYDGKLKGLHDRANWFVRFFDYL